MSSLTFEEWLMKKYGLKPEQLTYVTFDKYWFEYQKETGKLTPPYEPQVPSIIMDVYTTINGKTYSGDINVKCRKNAECIFTIYIRCGKDATYTIAFQRVPGGQLVTQSLPLKAGVSSFSWTWIINYSGEYTINVELYENNDLADRKSFKHIIQLEEEGGGGGGGGGVTSGLNEYSKKLTILDTAISGINYMKVDSVFFMPACRLKKAELWVEGLRNYFPQLPSWQGTAVATLNNTDVSRCLLNEKVDVASILNLGGQNYFKVEIWGIAFNTTCKAFLEYTYEATSEENQQITQQIKEYTEQNVTKIITQNIQGQTTTTTQTPTITDILAQLPSLIQLIIVFMIILIVFMIIIKVIGLL